MYDKHAVWCQCSAITYFVLGLSIFSSSMIWSHDSLWGILFLSLGLVRFCNAEHAPIFGISIDWWVFINNKTSAFVIGLIGWRTLWWYLLPVCIAIPHRQELLLPAFVLLQLLHGTIDFTTLYAVVKNVPIRIVGKSMASKEQKMRFAQFSIQNVLEALVLWNYRCSQRFPFTFRTKPVVCSCFGVCLAIVYCHLYVSPTKVSQNSIITKGGHGVAASLTAAVACEICASTLTSLDMESSFGE